MQWYLSKLVYQWVVYLLLPQQEDQLIQALQDKLIRVWEGWCHLETLAHEAPPEEEEGREGKGQEFKNCSESHVLQ